MSRAVQYGFFAALLLSPVSVRSQQFRGSITGRVIDSQQAVVPGVKVAAIEGETQARYETVSGATGQYTLPFLQPSRYRLEAEVSGFKRYIRENVHVSANDQIGLDILLEVGQMAESVTVTAEAPMLITTTASTGQVVSATFIEAFPLNGRSPLSLAQIAFGVVPTSDPLFQRPFDNGRISDFSMGGAPGASNELLLDGAPDTTSGKQVAYSPPVDTVGEVKVETFQVDAAYGNTGGGTVNVVSKSGANEFHGTAYDFNQVSKTAATDFFVNRAGQKKTNLVYNQWGFTAGGPVLIPRLFNGRNRVFWYVAYEGIKHVNPEPVTTTVPDAAEREGNFAQLLSLGSSYQIYDPATGALEGARIRRSPLAGNLVPRSRLNPIALKYLPYYPLPNQTGRADGRDNFLANSTRRENFNSETGRIDFNLSQSHKFFFSFRHNERLQDRGNYFKNVATGNFLNRINWGGTLDDVVTLNPTTVLNTRLNWTRYNPGGYRPSAGFDQTSLGFPAALAAASSQAVMPQASIGGFQTLGTTGTAMAPFDQYQLFSSLNKIVGSHSLKFGADVRVYRESASNLGSSSGSYSFGSNWTRGPLDNSTAAPIGQELASFLLGLPTGGQYDVASFRTNQAGYAAFFLQDDWKVRRNLTLNLGLRYEKELPTTERFDRQVAGFDGVSANSVTARAKQAYATSPVSELPAAQFNPAGGVLFAGPQRRAVTETSSRLFSPRFGFAWTPSGLGAKTTVRGGFGVFYFTEGLKPGAQPGYFQSNQLVATLDSYRTPAATLSNPFPNGLQAPVGNALGLDTFLGQSVNFYNPALRNPYSLRWNFTLQRQLSANLVMEAGYMGNHAVRLNSNRGLNWVPEQFLSRQPFRDPPVIDRLTANVANPFRGLLPGTSLNGNTVALNQLLRPFAQFSGDNGVRLDSDGYGGSYFHTFQFRLEKRMSRGLTYMLNYQWSRLIEQRSYLNPADRRPEKRVASEDRPQRLVLSSVYEMPFGKGKAVGASAGPVLNRIIGGWTVSGAYTFASGEALGWGNVIYLGGALGYDPRRVDGTFAATRFNTDSRLQLANNIRTFPSRFGNLRQNGPSNFDATIIKNVPVRESIRMQFRTEFFNALNHPQFGMPNTTPTSSSFGRITAQYNLPRTVQMALRLLW
ncbi:MAG: TonB-dependent receptor [Acidobacteria bacterium]|nr:TonB-dependent receptor [Acidobacteriota bacterium]